MCSRKYDHDPQYLKHGLYLKKQYLQFFHIASPRNIGLWYCNWVSDNLKEGGKFNGMDAWQTLVAIE